MAKHNSEQLDRVYHALANGCRRRIITRLCRESCTITELSEPFDMSLAAVSKHIKVLEKAGFVKKRKEGATFYCTVDVEPIKSAAALIRYMEDFLEK